MSEQRKVSISKLATGVPGFDEVLGGGLPEYSFNLLAGAPGTGKTTLALQILFANATAERPAIYFTILGEPPLKMLRYQQQFAFFDVDAVGERVRFVNLTEEALLRDPEALLARMVREVEAQSPSFVAVDSFHGLTHTGIEDPAILELILRLALQMTSWQATTFLVGEYQRVDLQEGAFQTVTDGIVWLQRDVERNSSVQRLQVMKMRGQAPMPGLHTYRINAKGFEVFPRIPRSERENPHRDLTTRISIGVPALDVLLGGGPITGDAVLVAGPTGTGKSVLSAQFIAAGATAGEPGVLAVFEERPSEYLQRIQRLGFDFEEMLRAGLLQILYLRPLDLSIDEALREIEDQIRAIGARRLVIDSLSGFELALAPAFRTDFRESLYRMVGALTGVGVTTLMTVEVVASYTTLSFSPHEISFLTDDVLLLRYVELEGQLRKVLTVVKMRNSDHSRDLCRYEVTARGIVVGSTMRDYRGILTGAPGRVPRSAAKARRGRAR